MSEIALLAGGETSIDLDTVIDKDGFYYLSVCGSHGMSLAVTRDDLVALNNSLTKFLEKK